MTNYLKKLEIVMVKKYFDKHWFKFTLLILATSTIVAIKILESIFCTGQPQELCDSFYDFIPSTIEISIAIGIAILIHNHTRKLEKKDNDELALTIHGIYLHLWSLHLALIPYLNSIEVRNNNTTAIQILNLINHSLSDLSKCGKIISNKTIEKLQLHLALIRTAISVSLDPRSDIEKYWQENESKVKIAFEVIKNIATKEIEEHIVASQKIVWRDMD